MTTSSDSKLSLVSQDSAIQVTEPTEPVPATAPTEEDADPQGPAQVASVTHPDPDSYDNASDSGWDSGSLIGDDTYTLASSIMNYRLENGRQYHAYRDGAYWVSGLFFAQRMVQHCSLCMWWRLTGAGSERRACKGNSRLCSPHVLADPRP